MKKLALIGSKDFAVQIRGFAEDTLNYIVVGYIDDFEEVGTMIHGLPVLGSRTDALVLYSQGVFDCLFLAAGYNNFKFREEAFSELKGKIPFANIISKSAHVATDCVLGEGIYIGVNSTIDDRTIIGDNVFIHGGTSIGHDNVINSHTYLSGRIDTCGFCTIGKRCFIGIRVLVADHISICDDSWIGIGCIVAKNIVNPGKYMTSAAKLYQIE